MIDFDIPRDLEGPETFEYEPAEDLLAGIGIASAPSDVGGTPFVGTRGSAKADHAHRGVAALLVDETLLRGTIELVEGTDIDYATDEVARTLTVGLAADFWSTDKVATGDWDFQGAVDMDTLDISGILSVDAIQSRSGSPEGDIEFASDLFLNDNDIFGVHALDAQELWVDDIYAASGSPYGTVTMNADLAMTGNITMPEDGSIGLSGAAWVFDASAGEIRADATKGVYIRADYDNSTAYCRIVNVSSTGDAGARLEAYTAGAGDAFVKCQIEGGAQWTFGIDNSDGDVFKIHNAGTLADTSLFTLTTAGALTLAAGLTVGGNITMPEDGWIGLSAATARFDFDAADAVELKGVWSFVVRKTRDNAPVRSAVINFSEVGNAAAYFYAYTLGAGDTYLHLASGTYDWVAGVDNSDSDSYKIHNAGTLADASLFTLTTAGALSLSGAVTGANIYVPDDGTMGISGDVLLTFDSTPATSQINLTAGALMIGGAQRLYFEAVGSTQGTEYITSGADGYLDVHWGDDDKGCRFYSGANLLWTVQRYSGPGNTHTKIVAPVSHNFYVGATRLNFWTASVMTNYVNTKMADNVVVYLGTGGGIGTPTGDVALYFNAANFIIDPDFIGSGKVYIGATADDDLCAANIAIGGTDTSAAPLTVTGNIRSVTTGKHEFRSAANNLRSDGVNHLDIEGGTHLDFIINTNEVANFAATLFTVSLPTIHHVYSGDALLWVENTSTANRARLLLQIDNGANVTGDPVVTFDINNTRWTMGMDNSDDDKLKFNPGLTLDDPSVFELSGTTLELNGDLAMGSGYGVFADYGDFQELWVDTIHAAGGSPYGTIAVEAEVEVLQKAKITAEGGYAVKLTNGTGVNSVKGTVVQADPDVDNAVELAPGDSVDAIGVMYDNGVANGAECWVVMHGVAAVLLKDGTASTRGNWVKVSDVAGRAEATGAVPSPPTGAEHFKEVGHCLENQGAGTDVLANIAVHFN